MNTLGLYIFNSTRNQWYAGGTEHKPRWASFSDAVEFTGDGDPTVVEQLRERISDDDVTFTMAALH